MSHDLTSQLPDGERNESQPPGAAAPSLAQAVERPFYGLHPPIHIAVATLLGSPLAGCVLMAFNCRALKRYRELGGVIAFGLLTSFALLLFMLQPYCDLGSLLSIEKLAAWSGASVLMYFLADHLQGRHHREHKARGGGNSPMWLAIVAGFASTGALSAIFYSGISRGRNEPPGRELVYLPGQSVYLDYVNGATIQDAQDVASLLNEAGWFNDHPGCYAILSYEGHALVVRFQVRGAANDDPASVDDYRALYARLTKKAVSNHPLFFRLSDKHGRSKFVIGEGVPRQN